MLNETAKDEDVQRRGMIALVYCIGRGMQISSPESNQQLISELGSFIRYAAPVRIAKVHYVYDNSILKETENLLGSVLNDNTCNRLTTHYGK